MPVRKLLDWRIWLVLSLTLGLAPFNPPHLWGKLQWVAGGAVGMAFRDWFDLLLHGTPWVLLLVSLVLLVINRKRG